MPRLTLRDSSFARSLVTTSSGRRSRPAAWRLTPSALAVAAMLAGGGLALPQGAQAANWFAASSQAGPQARAAQRGPMPGVAMPSAIRQQAEARQQLSKSIANLNRTANAIAAQQASQEAARAQALAAPSAVPDGLAVGGLQVATGSKAGWQGAEAARAAGDGRTVVVTQTAERAILNWETFNVGRNTTLRFEQKASDAVLNKVVGASAAPSQIQGAIQADGTVMIVNQNGVVFGAGSQVNVRNLVAAAARADDALDAQFLDPQGGIYSNGATPSLREAWGEVRVERGARIATHVPGSVTEGGGYVLLAGQAARNAGTILTPQGQAMLAAGDSFVIRKGVTTDIVQGGTTYSTVRGNEVSPRAEAGLDASRIDASLTRGLAANEGLILATEGDIVLAGGIVRQEGARNGLPGGVAVASTSVNARGAIHLLNSASDAQGRVTLGAGSVTAIVAGIVQLGEDGTVTLGEDGRTALDSQRDALITQSDTQDVLRGRAAELAAGGLFDNLWAGRDRRDQSRLEIVTGGRVDIEGGDAGALALATGGQIAMTAGSDPASGTGRIQLRQGALLDAAGSVGVRLSMADNAIKINIQGNELRDAPVNRDSDSENNRSLLSSLDVWIDRRTLVSADGRWYSANGLLEVSGWLANVGQGIGAWTAQGGTVSLRGGQVLTEAGSVINVSGGTLDVQSGWLNQSWLRGIDGRLYEVSRAPADMTYLGLYRGYEVAHARWGEGAKRRFHDPLQAPTQRWEDGYTVGRDAGRLILDTPTAVLQGNIETTVYDGARQTRAPDAALADGYQQTQSHLARAGGLVLGRYGYETFARLAGRVGVHDSTLVLGDVAAIALSLDEDDALQADPARAGTVWLDTNWLNAQRFGTLDLAVGGTVQVGGKPGDTATGSPALYLADGGSLRLAGAEVTLAGDIVARGGSISASNHFTPSGAQEADADAPVSRVLNGVAAPTLTVAPGVTLDVRGLWVDARERLAPSELAWLDGGSVHLASSRNLTVSAGARIDASGGGALLPKGKVRGGAGGDVTLLTAEGVGMREGHLVLDGEVLGYGVEGAGSGTLRLRSGDAIALGAPLLAQPGQLGAGEIAQVDLRLAQAVSLAAGTPAPLPIALQITQLAGGDTVPAELSWTGNNLPVPNVLLGAGGWDVSALPNITIQAEIGGVSQWYGRNNPGGTKLIPAGARITAIWGGSTLPAGYQLPTSLLGPLAVPTVTVTVAKGQAMPRDHVLAVGSVLPAGTVMDRALAVAPVMTLDAAWLGKGFSRYEVDSRLAVGVPAGARVATAVPVYRWTADVGNLAVGASQSEAMALLRDVPLFEKDPVAATLTPRAGASLVLRAGGPSGYEGWREGGNISVGKNAAIVVDPGQEIVLAAGGQITVDGHLEAPGGRIHVLHEKLKASQLTDVPGGRSIWIGGTATLDAAGRAWEETDVAGRRYGKVLQGGSIVLGSVGGDFLSPIQDGDKGLENAADAFVVLRPGARLDVSGAQATFDVPTLAVAAPWGIFRNASVRKTAAPVTVASDGGQIVLRSYYGIYNDATMLAHAGGAGASGGELSLNLETVIYSRPASAGGDDWQIPAHLGRARVVTVSQDALAWQLAEGLAPGQAHDSLAIGRASVSVSQIEAGGFDSLSLMGRGAIAFDGDVDLTLGRQLTLRRGVLVGATPEARVNLSAPHVFLDGRTELSYSWAKVVDAMPVYAENGALRVQGGTMDVRNRVQSLFGETTLSAQGDLRFLAGTAFDDAAGGQASSLSLSSILVSPGDIALRAAQVYPATGVKAVVYAGHRFSTSMNGTQTRTYIRDAALTVARSEGATPGLPYSVFGSLTLTASQILQGGVLRAPLGTILVGSMENFAEQKAMRVELLPGSETSVSAAGLFMPYGGTADGTRYTVDGGDPYTVQLLTGFRLPSSSFVPNYNNSDSGTVQGIALGAANIISHPGALLDLAGGGELLGAAFVAGRGGSVDTLLNARQAGGKVYAIVPGATTTPVAGGYYEAWTGAVPGIGAQITLADGVPGLPAGTYTLMPANYALLPGAFRVELGGSQLGAGSQPVHLRDGSWHVSAQRGVAGTGAREALPVAINLAPGSLARTWSQYNETSYDAFQLNRAATFGTVRPLLARDGKFLTLGFERLPAGKGDAAEPVLRFDGQTRMAGEAGHAGQVWGANLVLMPGLSQGNYNNSEAEFLITAPGSTAQRASQRIPLSADAINAIGAPNLYVGAMPTIDPTDGTVVDFSWGNRALALGVTLESGAVLRGGQVILSAKNDISLQAGAVIDTLGWGQTAPDTLGTGYFYGAGTPLLLASNGMLVPGEPLRNSAANARIQLGDGAAVRTERSIGFAATQGVSVQGTPRLATRVLTLAVPSLNVGDGNVLSHVDGLGLLPVGMDLSQATLDGLLAGDPATGAPAVSQLILSASHAINFYGNVSLDTYDEQGRSRLASLVLRSPALYGWGGQGDVVSLSTDTLVWSGMLKMPTNLTQQPTSYASSAPGAFVPGGAGTGSGQFTVNARRILLGQSSQDLGRKDIDFNRLMLGFSQVTLGASEAVLAGGTGNVSVFQSGPNPDANYDAKTYAGQGGALTLRTPLLAGEAAANLQWRVGGLLSLVAPEGVQADAALAGLGVTQRLSAGAIHLDGTVALPSGRLQLDAKGDIALAAGSRLNLAGRATTFFDAMDYGWGGDVIAESREGSVIQQAGSVIDLSGAVRSDGQVQGAAGRLQAVAVHTGSGAGRVLLDGMLAARGASDDQGGAISVRARQIGTDASQLDADFSALNDRLNAGGFTRSRHYALQQGNLRIGGDTLRAREVVVSVDAGSLTVAGRIDAHGATPGTIRLSARDGLTLASTAVLDAHGTRLRRDSYGAVIEAANRGLIALSVGQPGTLTLEGGATLDVSVPQDARLGALNLGEVALETWRTGETSGDVKLAVTGDVNVLGARSVTVSGFWGYSPTDADGSVVQNNGDASNRPVGADGMVGLDQVHQRSLAFMQNAQGNGALATRLGRLSGATLLPGVDITRAEVKEGTTQWVVPGDARPAWFDGGRYTFTANRDRIIPNWDMVFGGDGNPPVFSIVDKDGNIVWDPDFLWNTYSNDFWNIDGNGNLSWNWDYLPATLPAKGVLRAGEEYTLLFRMDYSARPDGFQKAMEMFFPQGVGLALPASQLSSGTLTVKGDIDLARYRYGQAGAETPGTLRLRAGGDLLIKGSLSDGFGPALTGVETVVRESAVTLGAARQITTAGLVLAANSRIPNSGTLDFSVVAGDSTRLAQGRTTTAAVVASGGVNLPLNTVVTANVYNPDGSLKWAAGTVLSSSLAADRRIAIGDRISAGFTAPASGNIFVVGTVIPAGTNLAMFQMATNPYFQVQATPLPVGATLPVGTYIAALSEDAALPAGAAMLAPGAHSWSMLLSAGANLASADPRGLQSASALGGRGNLVFDNARQSTAGVPILSVVRTGTGSLDLLAGGDFSMRSDFGIYTAGTQSLLPAGVAVPAGSYVAERGGDLRVIVQGNMSGYLDSSTQGAVFDSYAVNSWLVRSGNAQTGEPATWSIRYGQYVPNVNSGGTTFHGFHGLGALGGGNVDIDVGGDAGILNPPVDVDNHRRTEALVVAVGGSGYVTRVDKDAAGAVTGGELVQAGGGDLTLRVGGRLNRHHGNKAGNGAVGDDLNGLFVNLRGDIHLAAGAIGEIPLKYGVAQRGDPRAVDPYTANMVLDQPKAGPALVLGDSHARLESRGDLVLGGVADAGQILWSGRANSLFTLWQEGTSVELVSAGGNLVPLNTVADNNRSNEYWGTVRQLMLPSRFRAVATSGSLYAGGNALLEQAPFEGGWLELLAGDSFFNAAFFDPFAPGAQQIPDQGARWAVSGARHGLDDRPNPFKPHAHATNNYFSFRQWVRDTAEAGDSGKILRVYAVNGDLLNVSVGRRTGEIDPALGVSVRTLLAAPSAMYALAGRDMVNFGQGDTSGPGLIVHDHLTDVSVVAAGRDMFYTDLEVAGPGTLEVSAGRNLYQGDRGALVSIGRWAPGDKRSGADIVVQAGLGAGRLGEGQAAYAALAALYLDPARQADTRPGYPLADQPGKVAQVYSGELTLGQWLRAEHGYTGDEAGAEAWLAQRQAERNADASQTRRDLTEDYRTASKPYLVNWLQERYAVDTGVRFSDDGAPAVFAPSGAVDAATRQREAMAFFQRLAPEQQRVFLRGVYIAELRAGGREYNDPDSTRYGSYLRGRQAIAALFPAYDTRGDLAAHVLSGMDPDGADARGVSYAQQYAPMARGGDFTMFQGLTDNGGIRTIAGGDILSLVPAGATLIGVEGLRPAEGDTVTPAGLLTQGSGNISLYSQGSILLGLSRIMTTFGGHILAWSAEGDINAGRGAKTTVIYTPPRRLYDALGNVELSPQVPSSGAGIATLNPIPEATPGDVDLIAPLGTIDAGEAGIRVSGNVNIAALQVMNAANIQVQGDAVGIPVVAAVNVGALTNASAAAASAADAAQDTVARTRAAARQNLPSIISVQILGFGEGSDAAPVPRSQPQSSSGTPAPALSAYRTDSVVQVVGDGELSGAQRARLSAAERAKFGL